MRGALIFCCVLIFVCAANAQEQEKKLLDRLLKPDTTLQNDGQGKQFTGGGTTVTRKVRTKSFFFASRKPEKGFWNTRGMTTQQFATADAQDSRKIANLSTQTKIAKADTPYNARMYGDVRTARDATKSAPSSDYPGTRPFLVKGKSQKSLSAQDKALTIDEVRELLNKNK